MSKEVDIFNKEDLMDLPEKMRNALFKAKTKSKTIIDCMYDLFLLKNTLCADEVVIGLYRQFKMEKELEHIKTYLSVMKKRFMIVEAEKKGLFRIAILNKSKCCDADYKLLKNINYICVACDKRYY